MKKLLTVLSLTVLLSLFINNSQSFALPGQTETAFKTWVNSRPALKGIKKAHAACQQSEESNYYKEFILTGSTVYVNVWINCQTKKIQRESIGVEENFSDKKMVTLVDKIMGKDVLNDMTSATILFNGKATIDDATVDFMILKGSKYGFVIVKYATEDKYFAIDIYPTNIISEIANDIKKGRYYLY